MITEKEIAEYRTLLDTLSSLREKFLERKRGIRRLLEETFVLRKEAFVSLARANRLTKHLTAGQRQITGLSYRLNEITARVNKVNQYSPVVRFDETAKEEAFPEIWTGDPSVLPRYSRELQQKGIFLLTLIDRIRKNLLQLELLELRCRELILSINKAMEAFDHESRNIRRKLYPFGFFSVSYRFLRSLLGRSYFSPADLDEISALGNITGYVLKIADSPVI